MRDLELFLKLSEALKILVAADMVTKTIVDKIAMVASPTAFFFIRKIKFGNRDEVN